MGKIKIIVCLFAFIMLAGISCWATEQSLYLLLPSGWPEVLVWGITIAFFIVASWGSKIVVDSLTSSTFIDNRRMKLVGGVLLLIFFWLIMSMPTNTHTFFYNDQICSVISKDIKRTNHYLLQIIEKGTSSTIVLDSVGVKLKDDTEEERAHIVRQFNGDEPPYKRGNGEKISTHINNINKILKSSIIQDLNYNSADPAILNRYQIAINKALADALKTHTISEQSVLAARKQRARLSALRDSMEEHMSVRNLTESEIKQCEKELKDGYNIISVNKQFIDFSDSFNDREVYTKENVETRTKRMASVIDVFFVDFLQGKYPAAFWYYVLLSILVDIAAFIFFDIAFKNKND